MKYFLLFSFLFTNFYVFAKEVPKKELKLATFAGGCFWCMEHPFEELKGVKSVISGYAGGKKVDPNYYEVSSGATKHLESIQVTYDPKVINYKKLLKVFWSNIDPTDDGGQFVDRGNQYRTAIFYHSEEQKQLAEEYKEKINKLKIFKKPVVTAIRKFESFYPAEEYHQDFYKKNPQSIQRYKSYRAGSGRDQFIEKFWKPNLGKL
ncbi:MAG: peptide-methionine (S)-S-oxide reductase MsrA [Halobacteriovoraceae bacterium]|nr:peptide-methionine (S)-S-oxide reductase MsrA [Halobacteriovoraceae bacterium]MCB9095969.1 peptide-methionine (S)-S-oxide reductase MsrA [Halobacteriovoraceae bacterium]